MTASKKSFSMQATPLMELLAARFHDLPTMKKPIMTPEFTARCIAAARAWANLWKSDPFAYDVMFSKLKNGLEHPDEIVKDANEKLAIRQQAAHDAFLALKGIGA